MIRSRKNRYVWLLRFACVVVVQSSAGNVFGQSPGPMAPGPIERVAVVPHLGDSGARTQASGSDQVVSVQNAGQRTTRVLLIASYGPRADAGINPPAGDCPSCPPAVMACSEALATGQATTMHLDAAAFSTVLPAEADLQSAVLLSLNTRPAHEYGSQWTSAAELLELPGDASVADVVCARAKKPLPEAECPSPWALIAPFTMPPTASDSVWQGLQAAAMWGEPIAAVVTVPGQPGAPGQVTLDRYRALPYAEVWGPLPPTAERFDPTYYLPDVYLRTPDTMNSTLVLSNPGISCAQVTVTAYRTGGSRLAGEATVTVQPGRSLRLVPSATWPGPSTAAVRVMSDRPLGTALINTGYSTTSVHTGLAARSSAISWGLPRAYQEWRPVPTSSRAVTFGRAAEAGKIDLGGMPAGRDFAARQPSPNAAPLELSQAKVWSEAWETNIAIVNALDARRMITMYQYAEAKPPRPPISYPFEPWQQLMFQPGFGQGFPGGPGWARYESDGEAFYLAAESLREAADSLQWIEGWSTTAWPRDPGAPRTIAVPDLGGPAAGRPETSAPPDKRPLLRGRADELRAARPVDEARSRAVNDVAVEDVDAAALVGRVAIQNLTATPAEIELDMYSVTCGYAGTVGESIDPFQTVTYLVADLPGVSIGANAAIVRVMSGEVAVLTEQARAGLQPVKTAAPDVSSAYLGTPIQAALWAPTLPPARLGVSTNAFTITLPQAAPAIINVEDAANSGRCLTYEVTTDVGWLIVAPTAGDIPGLFEISVDRSALGPGERHVGHLYVRAREPNVTDSPRMIPITVLGRGSGGAKVFLPALRRGPSE